VDIVVLSAVAQPRLLARALAGATPASVVALTHLDQAETIGAALSVLVADERSDWPLEWLGFGQSIDDYHSLADLATVSQWALRGVYRSGMHANYS
jgi:signal recognition particle GTPase